MTRVNLLIAACLLLVGLLVGYIAGSGGPSLGEIDRTVGARIDAAGQAQADRIATLETEVADLGKRIDDVTAQVKSGSAAVQGLGDKLGGDLAGLSGSIGASVSAAGASSVAAVQNALSDLKADLESKAGAAQTAVTAALGAAGQKAASIVGGGAVPAGHGAGETVLLSNGAARVFVSRVEDDAATLYVQGTAVTLAPGETKAFQSDGQDCQVTLSGIDRGHVTLAGGCGSDLPVAEGTPTGTSVALADGAVRVFVSAVDQNGARVAVNGVALQTIEIGKPLSVVVGDKTCSVTLTGVDRGRASLDATCG